MVLLLQLSLGWSVVGVSNYELLGVASGNDNPVEKDSAPSGRGSPTPAGL